MVELLQPPVVRLVLLVQAAELVVGADQLLFEDIVPIGHGIGLLSSGSEWMESGPGGPALWDGGEKRRGPAAIALTGGPPPEHAPAGVPGGWGGRWMGSGSASRFGARITPRSALGYPRGGRRGARCGRCSNSPCGRRQLRSVLARPPPSAPRPSTAPLREGAAVMLTRGEDVRARLCQLQPQENTRGALAPKPAARPRP